MKIRLTTPDSLAFLAGLQIVVFLLGLAALIWIAADYKEWPKANIDANYKRFDAAISVLQLLSVTVAALGL